MGKVMTEEKNDVEASGRCNKWVARTRKREWAAGKK